jgi:hypothetical protein
MDQDPIHQFFSSTEADTDNVLYLALSLEPNASQAEITVRRSFSFNLFIDR